jgi:hypothetical protein
MAGTAYSGIVRRKTAPDFLVENMIWLMKQFLNPAPKTPGVHAGRRKKALQMYSGAYMMVVV